MLPTLYRPRIPSLFGEVDDLFADVWSRWPTIQHRTVASRFSSYEDEKGYVMQVTLPEGTTADEIKAEVKDGVLSLFIGKPEVVAQEVEVTEAASDADDGEGG
jgi:hypothetical protein